MVEQSLSALVTDAASPRGQSSCHTKQIIRDKASVLPVLVLIIWGTGSRCPHCQTGKKLERQFNNDKHPIALTVSEDGEGTNENDHGQFGDDNRTRERVSIIPILLTNTLRARNHEVISTYQSTPGVSWRLMGITNRYAQNYKNAIRRHRDLSETLDLNSLRCFHTMVYDHMVNQHQLGHLPSFVIYEEDGTERVELFPRPRGSKCEEMYPMVRKT